jgi:hypothetical protein
MCRNYIEEAISSGKTTSELIEIERRIGKEKREPAGKWNRLSRPMKFASQNHWITDDRNKIQK